MYVVKILDIDLLFMLFIVVRLSLIASSAELAPDSLDFYRDYSVICNFSLSEVGFMKGS